MNEIELERLMVRLQGDGSSYQKMMADTERTSARVTATIGAHSQRIGAMGARLQGYAGAAGGGVAGLLGVGGAVATVSSAISGYAQREQTEIAFTALIGNAELAKDTLKDLYRFAAETPFESPEILAAAKQMIAFGEDARNLVPTMQSLGDVSAGLNIPLGQLTYLFGTLKSQGIAHTVDINQFAMRGIPIWQELEKITGKTNAELRQMVEHGQVGFPIVEQAFKNMTKEGGKFHGQLEKQSKSLSGLFSTLKDNVGMAMADLGQDISDSLGLKGMVKNAGDVAGTVADLFRGLSPETKRWVVLLGLGAVALGGVLLVLPLIQTAALAAFAPFGLLLGSLLTVPGVLLAAAAAVVHFSDNWGAVDKASQSTFSYLRRNVYELGEYFKTTWQGMAAAVGAGDLELAFKIAAKRVEVEFFYLTTGLKGYWGEMVGGANGLTDQWYRFTEQFKIEANEVERVWTLVTEAMKSQFGLSDTTKQEVNKRFDEFREVIKLKSAIEKSERDRSSLEDKKAAVAAAQALEGELTNLERYARVKAAFRAAFKSGVAEAAAAAANTQVPPAVMKIVPKFDAAEWGSAEMQSRIAEWRDKMGISPSPGKLRQGAFEDSGDSVRGGGLASESGDRENMNLTQIFKQIEQNTRNAVVVGPAGLRGDDVGGGEF